MAKTVGVLALQGDFAEHAQMLQRMGHRVVEVRLPHHLEGLDALIMPGGESTTFGKLAVRWGLIEPIRQFALSGKPVWGTCAGLIFLAKDVGRDQPTLGLMDIQVTRNAFGRQIDSFITPVQVRGLAGPAFMGVFIRAPRINTVGSGVEVLAELDDGAIVAARQGNLLATSFHPELTQDTRMHAFFLSL
ncbi:MAG: pyridoxal 5'-phosphate synthase glutaminase subunit PdxT [Anaerolineae bacterium]|nr:pyridoxal 5'-phosphate synthase glutaminase subunit PdxT [Thermoflexales bacterium]MDW8395618.1 pyridoxal 5'-phosphate synthase glutaminase subunit PdxT [Anaerolineae bacterium]